MPDTFEKLYEEFRNRLPRHIAADDDLLKELLNIQKEGGKDALQDKLKEMIEQVGEGED